MSTDPTDFTPPGLEEIAALLPSYEIISFIAKGGMGAVYMARQKSLDRDVAIKVLPRHFGEDAEFRASFETEAKNMAKLNHPNLIGIYDFGQIDGLLYIIMEMVQGQSLFHSAYGKTIEPTEAARVVSEICHGLDHAHKHGILHRDIKPANILLDPSASPKIGDFGLARPVG
ncbi:protein kinase, partial [bacterium DOLZORAL124_64_63]